MEKIFLSLKKETIDKVKDVPLIKAAFNEKIKKATLKHSGMKNKTVKLSP